jgi:hypothetical protein
LCFFIYFFVILLFLAHRERCPERVEGGADIAEAEEHPIVKMEQLAEALPIEDDLQCLTILYK